MSNQDQPSFPIFVIKKGSGYAMDTEPYPAFAGPLSYTIDTEGGHMFTASVVKGRGTP